MDVYLVTLSKEVLHRAVRTEANELLTSEADNIDSAEAAEYSEHNAAGVLVVPPHKRECKRCFPSGAPTNATELPLMDEVPEE